MARIYGSAASPSFAFNHTGLPVLEAVCRVARRLWPHKTAHQLAARAGCTHRAAELWLSDRCGLHSERLADLLRSDVGFEVLTELMGDVKPAWWPAFVASMELAAIERRQEENRKAIEGLRSVLAVK